MGVKKVLNLNCFGIKIDVNAGYDCNKGIIMDTKDGSVMKTLTVSAFERCGIYFVISSVFLI